MFDIGFWELIIIAIIGLIVLGPERLPIAIRNVAHMIGKVRKMATDVQNELEQEIKLQELKEDLKKVEQMEGSILPPDLQKSIDELKNTVNEVQRPYAKNQEQSSEAVNLYKSEHSQSDQNKKE